jgi:predicted transcriptional regulator
MGMILTEQEKEIYPYIINFVSNNRMIELDKLKSYLRIIASNDAINLNYEGIQHTIQNLIEKKVILEGARLTREQILNNLNRKKVFEYICDNPGVYHYQIAKNLNLANHIIEWHIEILLNYDYIKEIQLDNHQIYHESDISPEQAVIHYYYRNDKVLQIIKFLETQPNGVSKTKIAKQLNMHPNTVKKYVEELLKYNIINKKSNQLALN